ncbi:MAG: hypothetical protein HY818_00300 [Acetobacterium woodii]|nr:hypothetical protein [Acetobacterium woodii]
MENGEKKKNLSNGTSWFIWGGVAGVFAISSRNTLAIVIFAVIACLLIFVGLGKRKIFNETYLEDNSTEPVKEIDEPNGLLNDVKYDVIPEGKNDDNTPPEDH